VGEERESGVALLAVEALHAEHATPLGPVTAARDVTFAVAPGESVALVGESGSGKTTIARCIAGLHAPASGRILLEGASLAPLAARRPREARRRIQIVFQNPYDSLNPRRRIGDAIARPSRFFRGLGAAEARADALALLERVRLPARLGGRYPSELSGGERQRAAVARALAARPDLLVCDEITSALDVSVQAAVLELLAELRAELGLVLLFISHDLGVVTSVCDRILVLKDGVVREEGAVRDVVKQPADAYTRALLEAAPRLAHADEGRA
jgi:peptide/nickel transport system ATP-binding protein